MSDNDIVYIMEYYTSSKPNLISDKTVELFNKTIDKLVKDKQSIWMKIYDVVIYPYLGVFILLTLVTIFLLYRYYHRENFGGIDSPKERIARPVLNPYYPVSEQKSYVNYTPDQIPLYIDGEFVNNIQHEDGEYDVTHLSPHPPTSDNVVSPAPYSIQYGGSYYRGMSNDVSDDMNLDLVKMGQENLNEYDKILKQKLQMESPFDVDGILDV